MKNNDVYKEFGIEDALVIIAKEVEGEIRPLFEDIEDNSLYHQGNVLKAFQETGISDIHFGWNTGYGYDDIGREAVERVFAKVFKGEKALVRPNIVNGTHAISLALMGLLKPGDKLIYSTGTPYDSLHSVIDYLKEQGIEYMEVPLLPDDTIDITTLSSCLDNKVSMIAIQRSKGYSWRNSITVNQIQKVKNLVEESGLHITIMVDNCYCEFVEPLEPIEAGADIICGSLIKNPGGGLALTGGYLVGNEDLIEKTSFRLTCPGIGAECGLTFGQNRSILQGLFIAPSITANALKGAVFCGQFFHKLGYEVCPNSFHGSKPHRSSNILHRTDIIQAVKLGSPKAVEAFCKGIQASSPVDSNVTPVAAPMPGYSDEIIMAAGTFVQGSSIELSCDGPLREPYIVYFQGGLTYNHAKLGAMQAAQHLVNAGILNI